MRLPTVSELPRATACAASVVLPREEEREMGAAAIRGTRIHSWIAAQLRGWPMPDIGRTKVSHINMAALREFIDQEDVLCELALSYDGTRVEVLGENIGRDYQRPGCLNGSIDIAWQRKRMGFVLDVKTGALPVPEPRDNWQIATLSAMYALPFEVDHVTGVVAHLNRDGSWSFEEHTWSTAKLAAIRCMLNEHRARWTEAHALESSGWGATPTPGAHCRFCKCVCSEKPAQFSEAA
jgi:hypothetical protein